MRRLVPSVAVVLVVFWSAASAFADCGRDPGGLCPAASLDVGMSVLSNPKEAWYSEQTAGMFFGVSATALAIGPRLQLLGVGIGWTGDASEPDYFNRYQEARSGMGLSEVTTTIGGWQGPYNPGCPRLRNLCRQR